MSVIAKTLENILMKDLDNLSPKQVKSLLGNLKKIQKVVKPSKSTLDFAKKGKVSMKTTKSQKSKVAKKASKGDKWIEYKCNFEVASDVDTFKKWLKENDIEDKFTSGRKDLKECVWKFESTLGLPKLLKLMQKCSDKNDTHGMTRTLNISSDYNGEIIHHW